MVRKDSTLSLILINQQSANFERVYYKILPNFLAGGQSDRDLHLYSDGG